MVEQIAGQDRREKIIQLTELGEEVYKACRKKITNLEMRVMEDIGKEEQEVVFHTLPKIQEKMMNKEGDMLSKPKLWTKDFIIVSTINFFLTIVFYLLIVIMGVYAVNEFNASISQAGLVTGIFIIGTLIGRLFIGRSIRVNWP